MPTQPFENGIRWGIIGVGDVCEVKSGPAFNRVEGSRLVAVMRRNAAKAEDYAGRHGVPRWYSDADELLKDPGVNAIYIATPPDSHAAYALKAAALGKPVYVEKPMARSFQECTDMVKACDEAGVPLFVAYYRRCLPYFLKVKSLIEEGAIGDIRFVDIRIRKPVQPDIVGASGQEDNWRVLPEIAGAGYFYDLGSHQLDLMDFFFGPIAAASGVAANQAGAYPAEDIVMGTFRFENGILGQGSWCFNAAPGDELEMTTVYGSLGKITFPFFNNYRITLHRAGREEEVFHVDMPKHIQEPLIRTIVDELLGKGRCPSTGVSGGRTNRVMEWMLDA